MVLSAAMTVYVTEYVKFCAPVGLMLAPVWAIVGVRFVTFVPYGTVTAIVPALSLMVPETPARVKEVIAFALLGATVTVTTYCFVLLSAGVTV